MKNLTVDYAGYTLEIEIKIPYYPICYPSVIGTCKELDSFVRKNGYGNYQDIIEEFIKVVDKRNEFNF